MVTLTQFMLAKQIGKNQQHIMALTTALGVLPYPVEQDPSSHKQGLMKQLLDEID